jgi:transposase
MVSKTTAFRFTDRQVRRPSIPLEKLLRAQLLQMLYSVRSERLLMEEIDYSILYQAKDMVALFTS